MSIKKGTMPPRYDEAFKTGAVKMVIEQSRPIKDVANELGICIDTLKVWLKRSGFQRGATDRQNRNDRRQREPESEYVRCAGKLLRNTRLLLSLM